MFNRFKYLELTSHHALKKAKKFIAESAKREDSESDQVIDVVFSSLLTLFISYLVEVYFTVEDKTTLDFWTIAKYMIFEIILMLIVSGYSGLQFLFWLYGVHIRYYVL